MSDAHIHLYPHNKEGELPPPSPEIYKVEYLQRYVDKAQRRGVDEITFTEHLYRFVESADLIGNVGERASDATIRANTLRDIERDRMLDALLRGRNAAALSPTSCCSSVFHVRGIRASEALPRLRPWYRECSRHSCRVRPRARRGRDRIR